MNNYIFQKVKMLFLRVRHISLVVLMEQLNDYDVAYSMSWYYVMKEKNNALSFFSLAACAGH